jgi:hypothetical protein
MKTTKPLRGLALLFVSAFSAAAQTITTAPTNGLTTITVQARTKDGKVPVHVDCVIDQPVPPAFTNQFHSWPPSVVGTSRDWMATNVPSGIFDVVLLDTNDDYAKDVHNSARLSIGAGTNYTVDFVLSNGADF